MPNIRVDFGYTVHDGTEIIFRSPVDCSQITGLIVYYPGVDGNTVSKEFVLADAHGNNVGDIDHLFAEDVVVKVILDVTKGMAFVQNADTNAYLEAQLASKAPAGYGLGGSKNASTLNLDDLCAPGWYHMNKTLTIATLTSDYWYLHVSAYGAGTTNCAQELFALNGSNSKLTRRKKGGTWGEWEFENPPMTPGVEFRTTERFSGKTVYTKLLHINSLPATSAATYDTGVQASKIIRSDHVIHTAAGYTVKSPYFIDDGTMYIRHLFLGTKLQIGTTYDYSGATADFQIWYVKD